MEEKIDSSNEMMDKLENFYIDKLTKDLSEINKKKKQKILVSDFQKIIDQIPLELLTEKVCLHLVSFNQGFALRLIPVEKRTLNVCLKALENHVCNIKFVPKDIINYKMCIDILKKEITENEINENEINIIMKHIPDKYKGDEIWDFLAEKGCLHYVPKDKRTKERCLSSIKNSSCSSYIPEEVFESDFCELICFEIIKYCLLYVPYKIKISEFGKVLCLESVKLSSYNLNYVPIEILTEEMIIQAIYTHYRKQDGGEVLEYIEKISPNGEWFTEEVCYALVDTYYWLEHIPKEKRSFKVCLRAVEKHDKDIKLISEDIKNDPEKMLIIYTSMAESGHLKHIPLEIMKNNNSELYKKYIMKGYSLKDIAMIGRTNDVCLLAVQKNGLNLEFVPSEEKSLKICITALNQNKKSFQFLPQKLQEEIIEEYLKNIF